MKMNEEATFAVYQKKLKGICEENDLQATFNRSGYPLTMTVRPLQDVAGQMSMLEKVEDNGYTSPDASIKFSYEDGAIKYTLSKEFVISDALFTKLKNQFRSTDGYTVIIGHRRLAAAKAAGLMELPCIVVEDMTLEEQISTMMTENMQRSDLTVYEEAEGFQMMMDFGNSVEQVADKAGFSESTIRRRVKLLSLDREAFKKSVKRGATLADFALLDKLDTEEAKNEVLKSVGTNNFRACLDRALREQKDRKTMNAIREVVASYATKADSKAAMPENCLFYASYGSWSGTVEAPADAGEHAYWYTESGYGITVYRERTEEDKPAEKTPEQLAREAKTEEYREKCRVIEEDEESAYRLRLNYLKEYGFPKKAAETVALAACRMMILNPDALGDMDEDTIEAVYGDGIYNDEHDLDTAVLMENAQVNPMKMLMVLLFALTEPVNHRVHDTEWLGGFYKCIKDDESVYPGIYSALDGIGYEISDMEKSLLDGTHPSYESAEEES